MGFKSSLARKIEKLLFKIIDWIEIPKSTLQCSCAEKKPIDVEDLKNYLQYVDKPSLNVYYSDEIPTAYYKGVSNNLSPLFSFPLPPPIVPEVGLQTKEALRKTILEKYKNLNKVDSLPRAKKLYQKIQALTDVCSSFFYFDRLQKWHEIVGHTIAGKYTMPTTPENEGIAIACGFLGLLLDVKKGVVKESDAKKLMKNWIRYYKLCEKEDEHRLAVERYLYDLDFNLPSYNLTRSLKRKVREILNS